MTAGRNSRITSRIMAAVRSRDTQPEIAVRKRLWALGYRYRVHAKVFGRPDVVFTTVRVALFIDGDFWHGNPEEWRRRGKATMAEMFPTRTTWWVAKIKRNIARDREVDRRLRDEGWLVLRIWESSIAANFDAVIRAIAQQVAKRSRSENKLRRLRTKRAVRSQERRAPESH
jgi:DNA mismatch endonuclease (patch repair protein)